jgi:hypothetical protein
MTLAELEARVAGLEQEVERLRRKVEGKPPAEHLRSWFRDSGRFANDSDFDEIVRLGREYRESLRPGPEEVEA